MTLQTEVQEADLMHCGLALNSWDQIKLQRLTAQEFAILVDGERAGVVRLGSGVPCEIGFFVFGTFRGRGVATAAVKKLTDAVLEAGHIDRVVAHVQNNNGASVRVLKKAGFTLVELNGDKMTFAKEP